MAGKYQRISPKTEKKPVWAKKPGKTAPGLQSQAAQVLNHEQQRLQSWLKTVHFKRAIFGVSEADVWKKISKLDSLYQAALSAERARYDALLEQAKKEWKGNTVEDGVPDVPKASPRGEACTNAIRPIEHSLDPGS